MSEQDRRPSVQSEARASIAQLVVQAKPRQHVELALLVVVLLGIALKVVLLLTSQSMADADEAVEGLMAVHILERGVHPLYPYGVNYGVGAGWEAHLAAIAFHLFGQSAIALKSIGLLHWLLTLLLCAALAYALAGREASLVAAALFAAAPQTAQWSLKVAGGHQVAVVLALVVFLLCVRKKWAPLALILAPLAVLAHPIVLPFVLAAIVYLFVRAEGIRTRFDYVGILVAATLMEFLILQPPAGSVWNPVAKDLDLIARFAAIPRLAIGLFTPNLNALSLSLSLQVAVGCLWLVALVLAAFKWRARGLLLVCLLAPWAILAIVDARELAPRHLLIVSPLAAVVLACAFPLKSLANMALLTTLAIAGISVQILETRDPSIYGPDLQSTGVERAMVQAIVAELEARGVHHVYCLDPMFQWNILFTSNERIVARWLDGQDRVPRYPARVDAARRTGQRIVVVYPLANTTPTQFAIVYDPPAAWIDENFLPALTETR